MVSTRIRIDDMGRFSSRSRNEKWGLPDAAMMRSIRRLMKASCPHLKFDSSTEMRFRWRATNFAAQILWLEFAEEVFFQTSEMSSGERMRPALDRKSTRLNSSHLG